MPATRSQYWLTGVLGTLSLASILYTFRDGEISNTFIQKREVESQNAIDTLNRDMNRLLRSIGNWQAFCEDPCRYIESASVHGSFNIFIKQGVDHDELMSFSQTERDAMGRCGFTKNHPQNAQFRLCLTVLEASSLPKANSWFDNKHLFELNVQFRHAGSKLLSSCSDLAGQGVEMQSYFSAYKAEVEGHDFKRISGGVRIPLEHGSHQTF